LVDALVLEWVGVDDVRRQVIFDGRSERSAARGRMSEAKTRDPRVGRELHEQYSYRLEVGQAGVGVIGPGQGTGTGQRNMEDIDVDLGD